LEMLQRVGQEVSDQKWTSGHGIFSRLTLNKQSSGYNNLLSA
jgi:hypothetical protein